MKGSGLRRSASSRFPTFAFRLHQFFTRGDTVWATIEPEADRHLEMSKLGSKPGEPDKPMYPLVFCRHCGTAYYRVSVQTDDNGSVLLPREDRREEGDDGQGMPTCTCLGGRPLAAGEGADVLERLPEFMKEPAAEGVERVRADCREDVPEPVFVDATGRIVSEGQGVAAALIRKNFLFCLRARLRRRLHQAPAIRARQAHHARRRQPQHGDDDPRGALADRTARRPDAEAGGPQAAAVHRQPAGRLAAGGALQRLRAGGAAALGAAQGGAGARRRRVSRTASCRAACSTRCRSAFEDYAADADVRGPGADRHPGRPAQGHRVLPVPRPAAGLARHGAEPRGLRPAELRVPRAHGRRRPAGGKGALGRRASGHRRPATRRNSSRRRRAPRAARRSCARSCCAPCSTCCGATSRSRAMCSTATSSRISSSRPARACSRARSGISRTRASWCRAVVAYPSLASTSEDRDGLFVSSYGSYGQYVRAHAEALSCRRARSSEASGRRAGHPVPVRGAQALRHRRAGARAARSRATRSTRMRCAGCRATARCARWTGRDCSISARSRPRPTATSCSATRASSTSRRCSRRASTRRRWRARTARSARTGSAARDLPLLFCSPTMELGVDIAQLNVVNMRNVPPTPANYAQRSGRAGRGGQPALVYTYCAGRSPHDQYYFRRPGQMVAGRGDAAPHRPAQPGPGALARPRGVDGGGEARPRQDADGRDRHPGRKTARFLCRSRSRWSRSSRIPCTGRGACEGQPADRQHSR